VHNLSVTLLISSLKYMFNTIHLKYMVGFTSCNSVSKESDNGSYTETRWHALKTVNPIGLKTIPKKFGRWSCLHLQVERRRGKLIPVCPSERTSPNSWTKCLHFWQCPSAVHLLSLKTKSL